MSEKEQLKDESYNPVVLNLFIWQAPTKDHDGGGAPAEMLLNFHSISVAMPLEDAACQSQKELAFLPPQPQAWSSVPPTIIGERALAALQRHSYISAPMPL